MKKLGWVLPFALAIVVGLAGCSKEEAEKTNPEQDALNKSAEASGATAAPPINPDAPMPGKPNHQNTTG